MPEFGVRNTRLSTKEQLFAGQVRTCHPSVDGVRKATPPKAR